VRCTKKASGGGIATHFTPYYAKHFGMAKSTKRNNGSKSAPAATGKRKAVKEPLAEVPRFSKANEKRKKAEEKEREDRQRKKDELKDQQEREKLDRIRREEAAVENSGQSDDDPAGRSEVSPTTDKENSPAPSEVSEEPLGTQPIEEDQRAALAKQEFVGCLVKRKHIRSYEQQLLNAKEYFAKNVIRSLKFPESADLVVGGPVYNGLARRLEVKPESATFRDFWTGDSGAGSGYKKLCITVLQSKRSSITSSIRKTVACKQFCVSVTKDHF
jgi:hypothetical protein